MFDNVGGKLKTIAKVECWVGIALSVIYGIAIMAGGASYGGSAGGGVGFIIGLLVAALGAFAAWISSLGIYALGELVENSDRVKKNSDRQNDALEEIVKMMKQDREKTALVPVGREERANKAMPVVSTNAAPVEQQPGADNALSDNVQNGELVTALRQYLSNGKAITLRMAYRKLSVQDQALLQPIINLPDDQLRSAAEKLLEQLS